MITCQGLLIMFPSARYNIIIKLYAIQVTVVRLKYISLATF